MGRLIIVSPVERAITTHTINNKTNSDKANLANKFLLAYVGLVKKKEHETVRQRNAGCHGCCLFPEDE